MPNHPIYTLDDGEQIHLAHPDTYEIPPAAERENLLPGQIVKLVFRITHRGGLDVERMWVSVLERRGDGYLGELDDDAFCAPEIASGMKIHFQARHVIQIYRD